MTAILKILTGTQEGAEVRLTTGQSYKIGGDFSADIALLDSMVAPNQGTILAQENGVQFTVQATGCYLGEEALAVGRTIDLPYYAVLTIGGTRLAVGQAGESWPTLNWTPLQDLQALPQPDAEEPAETAAADDATAEDAAAAAAADKKDRRSATGYAWLVILVILVILLALGAGAVFWKLSAPPVDMRSALHAHQLERLQKMATKYRLTLTKETLTGNLHEAATRREVETFVYTYFPHIRPDLTDDETIGNSVKQVLHGLESQNVVVEKVQERVAFVTGIAPSAEKWKEDLAILKRDVPKMLDCKGKVIFADETLIRLRNVLRLDRAFANVAVVWEKNQFVFSGIITEGSRESFLQMLQEVAKLVPKNVQMLNAVKWRSYTPAGTVAVASTPRVVGGIGDMPVTGIILQPFTCIQLNDGSKVTEGGTINGYIVEKIAPDQVVFRSGSRTEIWRP